MPGPLTIPLIMAGSSLLGQGIGAASTASINKKTRKWNEKMHALQRGESLADFAMQNQYNHPSSQMARLREAGLNPNLIYGEGAVANNAGQIKAAPVESWDPKPTQIDIGSAAGAGISAYYDSQVKQATIDNLRSQNTVIEQDGLLKAAQTIATTLAGQSTAQSIDVSKFDLSQKQRLADIHAKAAELANAKTMADTQYTLDENERKAAMQQPSLTIAAETILNMRLSRAKTDAEINHINQQIKNLKQDEELKTLDVELRRMGINPGDPMYFRILGRILNEAKTTNDIKKTLDDVWKGVKPKK